MVLITNERMDEKMEERMDTERTDERMDTVSSLQENFNSTMEPLCNARGRMVEFLKILKGL